MQTDLSRMLDQYDERRRVDLERERQSKDDDVQFLARFAKLRREVVRPVLEEAGALLAQRGHGFSIVEEEYAADAGGKVREAGISLHIAPAGMPAQLHAEDHERSLSITTRHYNKTVWVSGGRALHSGGTAGAKGAYAIERIDRQLIEGEVVRLVGAVMGG
jgi:hypothetical protein